MNSKNNISVVVAAFNEQDNIKPLYQSIKKHIPLEITNHEIVFVNDGSTDDTLIEMEKLVKKDQNVKIVNLSKNFGHEIAMTAGMDNASGDAVIFMDADLQHPPQYIPEMIKLWRESNKDIVLTRRTDNEDYTTIKKILNLMFHKILNFISDTKIEHNMPDFRLIDKKYISMLKRMNEGKRIFRGMLNWVGIDSKKCAVIEFKAPKRLHGETKYNFKKSLSLAANSILQFSIKPLRLSVYMGLLANIFSVCFGLFTVLEYFLYHKSPTGYTSLVAIVVFIGSVQLIALGIIGEYIGRIHLEVKNRPLYIADIITHEKTSQIHNNSR